MSAAVLTVERQGDAVAAWAATAPIGEGVLTPFGTLTPELMSQYGRLDALIALERVKAWADAEQARLIAYSVAHPDPVPAPARDRSTAAREFVREEIACALHWGIATTVERMQSATALVERLPATLERLTEDDLSYAHVRHLTRAVRELDEATTGKLEKRVLERAPQQTPAEFRRAVVRAVASLNPKGEAERHEDAAQQRRVCLRPEPDAMASLWALLPAAGAQTVAAAVQAVADKTAADDVRTADQKRADALVTICDAVLTGETVEGLPTQHGRRPHVLVSVALSTLLGIDEQPGDLDGYGPIPAHVAVRLAAEPGATWHRIVTDPIGQVIDYGRTTYRPPHDLTDFVIARDRRCRRPGCHRTARRCELDHITDWADGGPTSATNMQPLCGRDHDVKHDAGWHVRRLPDGTTRWTTPTGKVHDKPPETYPIDTTRPRLEPEPAEPEEDDPPDPPPF